MNTQKRNINHQIALQREKHNKVTQSLKDQIKALKERNETLVKANKNLLSKILFLSQKDYVDGVNFLSREEFLSEPAK